MKHVMLLAAIAAACSLSTLPALAHCGSGMGQGAHARYARPHVPFLQAEKAAGAASIVGMWDSVYTTSDGQFLQESFDTWHSDGSELEMADVPWLQGGNICVGIWKHVSGRSYKEYHTAWIYDENENVSGTILITANLKVARDNGSYSGDFDLKVLDLNGNILQEVNGTEVANRMSVD